MSSAIGTPPTFPFEEVQLAGRNHALPLEMLRDPITPLGLHYLLIHFDVPRVDAETWRLGIAGHVERPRELTLAELQARPAQTHAVTLECAGNGRGFLAERNMNQPWLEGAVGTAEWTGTPLAPLLEEAGLLDDALEVVFTGLDRGFQGGVEHAYERSLPVAEALREDALLVYAVNGQPLPPQHGFPLRLIVPGWYGMTQVKWLTAVSIVAEPFQGWQQTEAYILHQSEADPGTPVTRMVPRSLLAPPGIPDFLTRARFLAPGPCVLTGRAWSGFAPVERVEVSGDGGATWADAALDEPLAEFAWRGWRFEWDAQPGEHVLCCRATDRAGNVQPVEPAWNLGGYCNNAVQRVPVTVS